MILLPVVDSNAMVPMFFGLEIGHIIIIIQPLNDEEKVEKIQSLIRDISQVFNYTIGESEHIS